MPSASSILLAALALKLIDGISAATIPSHPSSPASPSVAAFESSACPDSNNCRTVWDIIWSCATTIFLCTWVSFHPSVPDPTFTRWRVTVVQILAVVFSFLIPELVVGVAAEEWWEARRYTSPFQGWTQTHTYFALMGGFVKTEDDIEGALDLGGIAKLTPDTHPELLAPVSNPASKNLSHGPSAETPHASAWDQERLPLISSTRSLSVNKLSSPEPSSQSASPQYQF